MLREKGTYSIKNDLILIVIMICRVTCDVGLLRLAVRLSATFLGSLVRVICNYNSFHSFIFKFCQMIIHTLEMCTGYFFKLKSSCICSVMKCTPIHT